MWKLSCDGDFLRTGRDRIGGAGALQALHLRPLRRAAKIGLFRE
jgi:hypothetical protein